MYRKYIQNLDKWYRNPRRKPLVVWGARQVGKTYLVKEIFAEEYFKKNYIYIDCKNDYTFTDYCFDHPNAQEVLNYLSLRTGKKIDKNTLLIFDEVQECLPLVSMLKYFCQNYREIPIIATGSMVRLKIKRTNNSNYPKKKQFLFPIGKINQITMYPMNFEEFMLNKNKILYEIIEKSFLEKKPLDSEIHKIAMNNFYDYLLVGGMPEAVDVFLNDNDYQGARETLIELYDNYLADMDLYQASPESIVRTKKIFENIFAELNKESKNFKCAMIEKDSKNRDMRSPIDWLLLANVVVKSTNVSGKVPFPIIDDEDSLFRLYLSDIGMFSYQSKVEPTSFIDSNYQNTLSGIFFENYVAIELVRAGFELDYWTGKGGGEFEFVIEDDGHIIPVDVKKGKGSLNSLKKFKEHNKFEYAIKVSSNNYGFDEENKILTVPFYQVPILLKTLRKTPTQTSNRNK